MTATQEAEIGADSEHSSALMESSTRGTVPALQSRMGHGARALIADDDHQMLAAVSDALAGMGFDVATAESGSGLIDRLALDGPFDLIVTDISMPWMDGLRTLRSVRSAGVTTPVVVMTALKDSGISTHVRALGTNSVLLRKPFEFGQLAEAVGELVPIARLKRKGGHE